MAVLCFLKTEASGFIDLLFPPACPLCGKACKMPPATFCASCIEKISPLASPFCPRCALPYPADGGSDHLCEECTREEPAFTRVYAAGIYEDALRLAIGMFKFQGRSEMDLPLARLLSDPLIQDGFVPDLIVPVPLHGARLSERTYNQALLLSRCLGRILGAPPGPRVLLRTRRTPPQQGLGAGERRSNPKGAFSLREAVNGRRVLLVDDVLTTGATVRECARILKKGQASEIRVAVLARARRES